MKTGLLVLTALAAWLSIGCPSSGVRVDGGHDHDGGIGEVDCPTGFCIGTFDTAAVYPAASFTPAFAVAQKNDTLGIAYFVPNADRFDILYRTWTPGTDAGVVSAAEKVTTVYIMQGLSIAFQPNGEPAITYIGGDDDGKNLAAWKNSDAVISYRNGGTWTEQIAVNTGDEAIAGNGPSDFGAVVGVYPAIGFDSTGKAYFTYRDVHAGQFEVQDYEKSDMEVAEGGPTSWTHSVILSGGVSPGAWGGSPRMLMVNNRPSVLSTACFHSSVGVGTDVWFTRRNANGTWLNAYKILGVGNTFSPPAFAYDPAVGYGMAVTELSGTQRLTYQASSSGDTPASWTNPADPVFENGSGGWYPTLAYEPGTHFPHVAYYVCALTTGVNEGACPANEDELDVAYRTSVRWEVATVNPGGGFQPWLFFISTGKRVLVYRDTSSASMKVALEQ